MLRRKGKKAAGVVAEKLVGLAGKVFHFENAYVELEKTTPEEAGLKNGEIVPYVIEGSVIKLVSAGSNDDELAGQKMSDGEKAEEDYQIGIITQPLEKAVGNVRTSAIKPMAYMISDVNNFKVREQNRFLITIVGVHSYFIRSLVEFDAEGNAVVLGSLEVTNPEVIPKNLSADDRKMLLEQFEMGKVFTELASTGIIIKTLREEVDRLSLQYLGPQVYQIVKSRDFAKLKGRQVRDATTMFADISGFTSLSDKLQDTPEEVTSLLQTMFAELTPFVDKNNGIVDKFIGDEIMAEWGVIKESTSSVEDSVRSAIEIQRHLKHLNETKLRPFYEQHKLTPRGISIGLNTGNVIAGNIGFEGSKIQFTVISDAVNVAKRLEGAANTGQIVIGKRTFALLSETFKIELAYDFNQYNRDIKGLKAFVVAQLKKEGKPIDEADLDRKLQRYVELYEDATPEDIFVPGVAWGKHKGAIPCYYVRWDKHAWRYKYLEAAGIELGEKSTFETQPPTPAEVRKKIEEEPPAHHEAMREAYRGLLVKRTSTPAS